MVSQKLLQCPSNPLMTTTSGSLESILGVPPLTSKVFEGPVIDLVHYTFSRSRYIDVRFPIAKMMTDPTIESFMDID